MSRFSCIVFFALSLCLPLFAQRGDKGEAVAPTGSSPVAHAPEKQVNTVTKVVPLSPEDQKRFEAGKALYEATCIACHQVHGLGQEGLAPPLVDSEWVVGSDQRLARIVLNGLRGPIKVRGQKWDMEMPSLGVLEDQQIADVLTYIRREWGHAFAPVSVETVKNARKEAGQRGDAWTAEELLKIK